MIRAYYTIYGDIAKRKDLNSTDKIVFMVISNYTRLRSGVCSASCTSISKQAGIGVTATKRSIAKLLKVGLIKSNGKTNDSKHINLFTVDPIYLVTSSGSSSESDSPNETIRSNRETEVKDVLNTPTPEIENIVVKSEAPKEQLIFTKPISKYDHFKYNKNLSAEEKEQIDTDYSYWPVRISEQIPQVYNLPMTIQKDIRSDIIETQRTVKEIVEYLKDKVLKFIIQPNPGW